MIKIILFLFALVLVSSQAVYDNGVHQASTYDIKQFYKSDRKICMTDAKCKCSVDTASESIGECKARCQKSKRCYRISCQNPGEKYCTRVASNSCASKFPTNLFQQQKCVHETLSCCRRKEFGRCRKARRLFRLRSECALKARIQCNTGDNQCECVIKARKACIIQKTVEYKNNLRKFFSCNETAEWLCASKSCTCEYGTCVKAELKQCQPVCERESRELCANVATGPCYDAQKKKCVKKWKREYCNVRARLFCDLDEDCYNAFLQDCQTTTSTCMKNTEVDLCDDFNACTSDTCEPTLGCTYKDVVCKVGKCQTATCDKKLGCVYKNKQCDAASSPCYKTHCDGRTGQCREKFVESEVCTIPCQNDTQCHTWSTHAHPHRCVAGVCDTTTRTCTAVPRPNCATECKKTCTPTSECETAECVEQDGEYTCIRAQKDCDNVPTCFVGSCDPLKGCIKTPTEGCSNAHVCTTEDDCAQFSIDNDLDNKCLKAKCNHKSGVCQSVRDISKPCSFQNCTSACQAEDRCESTKCVQTQQGANALFQCTVQPTICGGNPCGGATCDKTTGSCVNHIVDCPTCNITSDCVTWANGKQYNPKCVSCFGQKCQLNKNCQRGGCDTECVSDDACSTSKCHYDSVSKTSQCVLSDHKCDDKNDCTVDSCIVSEDGQPQCQHEYQPSETCVQCQTEADCVEFGVENKVCENCQKAYCNVALGTCMTKPKKRACISLTQCQQNCNTNTKGCVSNTCKAIGCSYQCVTTTSSCNDNINCTLDHCDVKTGQCVNKFVKDNKQCLTPCNSTEVCQSYAQKINLDSCLKMRCNKDIGSCQIYSSKKSQALCVNKKVCNETCVANGCETVQCVQQSDDSVQCVRTPFSVSKCDDGNRCTDDTCQNGLCVNTCNKTISGCDCNICLHDQDCYKWSVNENLKANCEVGKCKRGTCVRRPSPDATCVKTSTCDLTCPSTNCKKATCYKEPTTGKVSCKYTEVAKFCDDGKSCTKDSCHEKTGRCINTYTEGPSCPKNGNCSSNSDCQKWALVNNVDRCLDAVCDQSAGGCALRFNGKKCKCDKCERKENKCSSPTEVLKSTCSYDKVGQLICEYTPIKCDDHNNCTQDTCDNKLGCVFTPVSSKDCTVCKVDTDCSLWGKQSKLAANCCEPICDIKSGVCKATKVNTLQCNPKLATCQATCKSTGCTSRGCRHSCKDPSKFTCEEKPLNCDDGNSCTFDYCKKGKCYNVWRTDNSTNCTQCNTANDCYKWGESLDLDSQCLKTNCVQNTCVAVKSFNGCKKCSLDCGNKRNKCLKSKCIRTKPNTNSFACSAPTLKACKSTACTSSVCDAKTGNCTKSSINNCQSCKKDLDCNAWAVSKNLDLTCADVFCNKTRKGCDIRPNPSKSASCITLCKSSTDCPQTGVFANQCCTVNGIQKCVSNQCNVDSDCNKQVKKGYWGYCEKKDSCSKVCNWKPVCGNNTDCDDKNPCTKDVCVKPFGFCRNEKRCVDNTLCTYDICIPGTDGKTYTCQNPSKSCTNNSALLDQQLSSLPTDKQKEWLGDCSHVTGCVSCVANNQCDDGDGCTNDYCDQNRRVCVNVFINNQFCDPKLVTQSIYVQSYIDVLPYLEKQGTKQ